MNNSVIDKDLHFLGNKLGLAVAYLETLGSVIDEITEPTTRDFVRDKWEQSTQAMENAVRVFKVARAEYQQMCIELSGNP